MSTFNLRAGAGMSLCAAVTIVAGCSTLPKEPGEEHRGSSRVGSAESVAAFGEPFGGGPRSLPARRPRVQVEVEMRFVAFNTKDIEAKIAKDPGSPVDIGFLYGLMRDGKSELLNAPKVVTQSGMDASVRDVVECMYPTTYSVETDTAKALRDAVGSVQASPGMVMPEDFETREVGAMLQVLPEVDLASQCITLTLSPEIVFAPAWQQFPITKDKDGKKVEATAELPYFRSWTVSTCVVVENGETVVVGGGLLDRSGEKGMIYAFATARLLGQNGKPFKSK